MSAETTHTVTLLTVVRAPLLVSCPLSRLFVRIRQHLHKTITKLPKVRGCNVQTLLSAQATAAKRLQGPQLELLVLGILNLSRHPD